MPDTKPITQEALERLDKEVAAANKHPFTYRDVARDSLLRNYPAIRALIRQQAKRIAELEAELATVREGYAESIEARGTQRTGTE